MDPKEQNFHIATYCGWKLKGFVHYDHSIESGVWINENNEEGKKVKIGLPDYLNDINAIRDAEIKLLKVYENEKLLFWRYVEEIKNKYDMTTEELSPIKRAEAFLRTIGKWVEC